MCGYFKSPSSRVEVPRKQGAGKARQQHKDEQDGVLSGSLFVRNSYSSISRVFILEPGIGLWVGPDSQTGQNAGHLPPPHTHTLATQSSFLSCYCNIFGSSHPFTNFIFYLTEKKNPVNTKLQLLASQCSFLILTSIQVHGHQCEAATESINFSLTAFLSSPFHMWIVKLQSPKAPNRQETYTALFISYQFLASL